MIRSLAFCVALYPGAGVADVADDILVMAHCLGQSDGYVEDATAYGDVTIVAEGTERQFGMLRDVFDGPTTLLDDARAAGLSDWRARSSVLQRDGATGPAWDAHVAAFARCGEVATRLRSARIIGD